MRGSISYLEQKLFAKAEGVMSEKRVFTDRALRNTDLFLGNTNNIKKDPIKSLNNVD